MEKINVAVVGGGISGLSIANLLQEKEFKVVVFEKEAELGGLVKCTIEEGVLFHRVGGHVFNTKNKNVLNWISKYVDFSNDFTLSKRNAKVLLNDQILGYPIENSIYKLPDNIVNKVLQELLKIHREKKTTKK
jgi:UDP-galactopyranose mutase